MERQSFIQNLSWGVLGFNTTNTPNHPDDNGIIYFGHLVGLSHYDLKYIYHHIQVGTELEMKREVNNVYDPNAIAVYYKSHKLGYVPKDGNTFLAKVLDSGSRLSLRVRKVLKTKYLPTTGLEVEVYDPCNKEIN